MRKVQKRLADLVGTGVLVGVDRKPLDSHVLEGFIVDASEELLLLHVVDGSTLMLNGYSVVRLADIRGIEPSTSFVPRALSLLGRIPSGAAGIDVSNWTSLLVSANDRDPLLMVECEKRAPGCGFVGRIEKLGKNGVHLREVDTNARWTGVEKYKLNELTQVTFGGGYLDALASVLDGEC